ncbi:MAG: AAA family ATPase [Leptolyngbya sp.]|nr:AAA family ATPase [Candidatus Melainabacteria bacterium]
MDAEQTRQASSQVLSILLNAIYFGFFGLMAYSIVMSIRQQRKMTKTQASGARKLRPETGKTTFKDVAGMDEVGEDLKALVDDIQNAETIKRLGGKPPKGILLIGPPGTGKTLLARAIAGEAGLPFFSISGSEFVEMFVGLGASRVRDLFSQARKNAPCIVFIDEIDAIGKQRGTGIGGGNDEREQTLNQLLTEMDGFEPSDGIIIIAATNRPDTLDAALMRPGRFDDILTVETPDIEGRRQIIKLYADQGLLNLDCDLELLAANTAGFSGAQIAAIFKTHAPKFAKKRGGKDVANINNDDLDKAVWKLVIGDSKVGKSRRLSDDVKRLLAVHEGGHAIVAHYLSTKNIDWKSAWGEPVVKITIIGAGNAGGYTATLPNEAASFPTKESLRGRITMALAANCAEEIFLGTTTTGASEDFKQAYGLAKQMVTKFGMSSLGPIYVGGDDQTPFLGRTIGAAEGYGLGEESSNQIDHEIKAILDECKARAVKILQDPVLKNFMEVVLVPHLISKETILKVEWSALWTANCLDVSVEI